MNGQQALIVILAGLFGGLVNAVVSGPLEMPHIVHISEQRVGLSLGLIGNMIIGGTASFTFWAIGLTTNVEPQVYAIAVVSGYGGARILTGLLEGQIARLERNLLADEAVESAKALREGRAILKSNDKE